MPSRALTPPGISEAFVDLPPGDGGALTEIPLLKVGSGYPQ